MIELGSRVRCKITGFEGVAVARIEHLHGVPEIKVDCLVDGRIHHEWIDEKKLEVIDTERCAGFR
jgi:hypothetical protein